FRLLHRRHLSWPEWSRRSCSSRHTRRERERKPRGRAKAESRVLSSNPSFGSVHSTYAEKQEVDGRGSEQDAQPGRAQIRPDDARKLGVVRAPLDELLVPAVLEGIRQPVRQEKRDVDTERCPLAPTRHAAGDAREKYRGQGEQDPVQPVVVAQVDGMERRL